MRLPLATPLESRDGTVTKDAKVLNAIIEPNGDAPAKLRGRPGNSDLGNIRSGTAQGAYYFNGHVVSLHGNTADRSTTGPLANTSIGTIQASYALTITRVGSVATASGSAIFYLPFLAGDSVTISGATQPEYNGTFTVTAATVSTFSFTVTGAPATPATGSPVAVLNGERFYFADNGRTVDSTGYLLVVGQSSIKRVTSGWSVSSSTPIRVTSGPSTEGIPVRLAHGAAYLDGYFFVMDRIGNIWNCDLNADPGYFDALATPQSVWALTSFIRADKESGAGVRLARVANFIVALKEFSTEVFYDAGNPAPGSPLSPVDNAFTHNGCASAGSVATVEGNLVFMSQGGAKGRGVHVMVASQQQKISTPDVDRVLDADDLATVYSYGFRVGGHAFYVLTLVTSNITLVYDFTAQAWSQWSSLTLNGSSKSVSSITVSDTTATVNSTAHGFADGDPVLMAGASSASFNGIKQISYINANSFSFELAATAAAPTGTITATGYTESYFKFTHYVNAGGKDLFLHETDGHIYQLSTSTYQDAGKPINVFTRSIRLDGGALGWKRLARFAIEGDTVSDYLMVRWSDDDSATHSSYRRVDLSLDRPNIRRCGAFRRRVIETRFIGNNPLRLEAAEIDTGG